MRIICVAGTSSGAGKTTVACALLRHLPGWAALKVTRCHTGEACPHRKACGVCRDLDEPYRLTEMTAENDLRGKDTWRLRAAGASPVFWLVARAEALDEGLKVALSKLAAAPGVVVEGTSTAALLDADLVVMARRRNCGVPSPSEPAAHLRADVELLFEDAESPLRMESECRRILAPVLADRGRR